MRPHWRLFGWLAAALACGGEGPRTAERGVGIPRGVDSVIVSPSSMVTFGWLTSEGDCLTCDNPARLMRSVQRRYPRAEVGLVMAIVGTQTELSRAFIAQERLEVEARVVNPKELRGLSGGGRLPMLYLAHGRRIVRTWSYRRDKERGPEWDVPAINMTLDSLLSASD